MVSPAEPIQHQGAAASEGRSRTTPRDGRNNAERRAFTPATLAGGLRAPASPKHRIAGKVRKTQGFQHPPAGPRRARIAPRRRFGPTPAASSIGNLLQTRNTMPLRRDYTLLDPHHGAGRA